jgi:HAMP domain-containing protein
VTTAEKYVTAAYLVVLAVVLLYVVLYAFKMARLQRQLDELVEARRERDGDAPAAEAPVPTRARPARLTRQ